jgi:hypothetical protein
VSGESSKKKSKYKHFIHSASSSAKIACGTGLCSDMFRLMKLLFCLCALLAAALFVPAGHYSPATSAQAASGRPLVIIRFNQRNVQYQRPLYQAVSRALNTAPDVHFEVISYMPSRPAEPQQLGGVVGTLQSMGVTQQQFSATTQAAPNATYEEVHIFVR